MDELSNNVHFIFIHFFSENLYHIREEILMCKI